MIYRFYMVCTLGSGAQPTSELPYLAQLSILPVGKGNPLYRKAHPLRPALATLCGCAVRFSCSIAKWELCFHFKKVEAEGIVSILLELQGFFLVELKGRSCY